MTRSGQRKRGVADRAAGWLGVRQLAALLGKSERGTRGILARLAGDGRLPPDAVRQRGGRRMLVCVPLIVSGLIDERVAKALAERDADPLLSGADSPALERYRLASAQLRELELAERRRHLVNVRLVRGALAVLGGSLRRAGETLRKHYGDAAAAVLQRALDDGGRAGRELLDASYEDDQGQSNYQTVRRVDCGGAAAETEEGTKKRKGRPCQENGPKQAGARRSPKNRATRQVVLIGSPTAAS